MLLTHNQIQCVKLETHLRIVKGTTYQKCKETCAAIEILASDDEWNEFIEEINMVLAPQEICDLFATIKIESPPSHVPHVYERHYEILTEDYAYKFQRNGISLSHY